MKNFHCLVVILILSINYAFTQSPVESEPEPFEASNEEDTAIKLPGLDVPSVMEIYRPNVTPGNRNTTTRYDNYPKEKKLYSFIKNRKHGIADEEGNILIPAEYDKLFGFRAVKKDKYGVVDLENKILVPFEYDKIDRFNSFGVAKAQKGPYYGYLNDKGEINLPVEFLEINELTATLCLAKTKEGLWGLYSLRGERKFKLFYESISFEKGRFFVVQKHGLYGVKTAQDNPVLPIEYDELTTLSDGYIILKKDNKMGLFKDGRGIVIPVEYAKIYVSNHKKPTKGFISFEKEEKSGKFRYDEVSKIFTEE